jgi:hypothetical protein
VCAVRINPAETTAARKTEIPNIRLAIRLLAGLLSAGILSSASAITPTITGKRSAKAPTSHLSRDEDIRANPPNAAPHLPPPGRQVERKQHDQILPDRRAESAGGG